jgi:hypothetical protein
MGKRRAKDTAFGVKKPYLQGKEELTARKTYKKRPAHLE